MIVNPSYTFYAKKEPLPDFNLWAPGVVYVPYKVSNGRWFPSEGLFAIEATGYAEFTVDAKGYSKIATEMAAGNTNGNVMKIMFYDSNGSFISESQQQLQKSRKSFTIDIPNAARISGAKIRFYNPHPVIRNTLYTATLQE